MATVEQFDAALLALNDATNAIAEEVARLRELISNGGLTPTQEIDVLNALGSIEGKLRALAAPPAPPVPGPEPA